MNAIERAYAMQRYAVLLIDDDQDFCDLLNEYLKDEGFDVTAVHDGQAGYERALTQGFDLIILDVMLPKLNGFEVLKKIKSARNLPVLMLTAKGEEVDQVIGLEIGADDYLPKPCSPRLLLARLRAILRRTQESEWESHDQRINLGNVALDHATRTVNVAHQTVVLTNSEYNILHCLMQQINTVVTKEDLSKTALNRDITAYDRSVDMHISHLRNKLAPFAECQLQIKTVRGIGYILSIKHSDN